MSNSVQSSEKVRFLNDTLEAVQTYRKRLDTSMEDCRMVAQTTKMAATDAIHNGMANIAGGMNSLFDSTISSFGGVAETLCRGAENIGPEFQSKIKNLADMYAAAGKGNVYTVINESTGLDDNMTPELKVTLENACLGIIDVRKQYIILLGEITKKALSDPDFAEVVISVGKASEDFGNETLLTSFNAVNDKLEGLGIFLKARVDELREVSGRINAAALPNSTAAALNI